MFFKWFFFACNTTHILDIIYDSKLNTLGWEVEYIINDFSQKFSEIFSFKSVSGSRREWAYFVTVVSHYSMFLLVRDERPGHGGELRAVEGPEQRPHLLGRAHEHQVRVQVHRSVVPAMANIMSRIIHLYWGIDNCYLWLRFFFYRSSGI